MLKSKDYVILTSFKGAEDLELKVNSAIKDGFTPLGGIAVYTYSQPPLASLVFSQAIIKQKKRQPNYDRPPLNSNMKFNHPFES